MPSATGGGGHGGRERGGAPDPVGVFIMGDRLGVEVPWRRCGAGCPEPGRGVRPARPRGPVRSALGVRRRGHRDTFRMRSGFGAVVRVLLARPCGPDRQATLGINPPYQPAVEQAEFAGPVEPGAAGRGRRRIRSRSRASHRGVAGGVAGRGRAGSWFGEGEDTAVLARLPAPRGMGRCGAAPRSTPRSVGRRPTTSKGRWSAGTQARRVTSWPVSTTFVPSGSDRHR